MKNRTTLIGMICTVLLSLTGCNEDSFLDRNPFGVLDDNTFFVKKEDADLAAIACYAPLQKPNLHWADSQLELGMSDDFSSQGFKDATSFYGATFNPNDNSVVRGVWARSYTGIAICNNNIANVMAMDNSIISQEDKSLYIAEMRFIRAFWYFRLIRFYGDVPLRIEPMSNVDDPNKTLLPRVSQSRIFSEVIIPDFKFAVENLPGTWDENNNKRATKGAAHAFLTEVYVYVKQYTKAIEHGRAVEQFGYSLLEDPGNVLRVDYEGNREIIFAVGYSAGVETFREFYYGTIEDLGTDGRIMRGDTYSGDYYYASENLISFYQAIDGKPIEASAYYDDSAPWQYRDPRFDATFFTVMDEIETTSGVKLNWQDKFLINDQTGFDIQKRGVWYGDNTWNRRVDFVYMRLPRVYLLLAEAYARKGDFSNANRYLEMTRGRARDFALANPKKYIPKGLAKGDVLPPFNPTNLEEALQAIDYEMRVELFTEDAFRYFDLKRWGTLSERWSSTGGFIWEDKLWNLPVPGSELNVNTKMKQNPGW